MKLFTQTSANVIFAFISTWVGLLAMNVIPDNATTHWITVAVSGLQIFLINLGFQRTPSGNVIPETVKKFVDQNVGNVIKSGTITGTENGPRIQP